MLKKQNDKKPENPHTKTKTLTLMVLIFAGTNFRGFRGFRTKSRKFVPAKCLDLSKPQN